MFITINTNKGKDILIITKIKAWSNAKMQRYFL
jgi:hypothetical protein